jgi:hypothetical protein
MGTFTEVLEFRCTRADLYDPSVSLGNRQGHYVRSEDERAARAEMQRRFPRDRWITVDFWKTVRVPVSV